MNIIGPTLLLDREKCRRNIRTMCEKAERSGVTFRPHFKTHHSIEIGRWFREEGIKKITVSSVNMAEYFAEDGWDDITIALTFNILETGKINNMLKKAIRINLIIDASETLDVLKKGLESEVSLFIKIDTGYNRTGILYDEVEKINAMIKSARGSRLRFTGFLTHAGHSYRAGTKEEILGIYKDTLVKMTGLKNRFLSEYPDLKISAGDTPTISIAPDLKGLDEIRPGNFVFYDLMQMELGSCIFENIAVILGAPVISKNFPRKEVVINAGAVHLSKEFIPGGSGSRNYGQPLLLSSRGWGEMSPGSRIISMSQEHSVIGADKNFFNSVSIGDVVGIVPVHSCLAANLAGSYLTTDGNRINKNRA